jgi:hypothetical protein
MLHLESVSKRLKQSVASRTWWILSVCLKKWVSNKIIIQSWTPEKVVCLQVMLDSVIMRQDFEQSGLVKSFICSWLLDSTISWNFFSSNLE